MEAVTTTNRNLLLNNSFMSESPIPKTTLRSTPAPKTAKGPAGLTGMRNKEAPGTRKSGGILTKRAHLKKIETRRT